MSRKIIIALLKIFFFFKARVRITGLEKLIQDKPVVATCNHIGFLDGLLIPTIRRIASHKNLIVIVAEKYQNRPVFKWAIDSLNFMFIDRFNPDVFTVRKVLRLLKDNGLLLVAPEGTRSPNAALIEAKSGAAYFAAKTKALIAPMAVTGTEDSVVKRKIKSFARIKVNITVGEPYTIPPLPAESREEFLEEQTDEIMCQIAALLPPSYRGVYADHPRLHQLLAERGEAVA
jgi:1-acyl-sn-glycerol-3-phosphate acyltransferase